MTGSIQLDPAIRGCVPSGLQRTLARVLGRVARRFALRPSQVTVRLVGEDEIRGLRATHLGEDASTDVLSFPAPDQAGGDLALCWPVLVRQAVAAGVAPAQEAVRLLVHALAHLSGHDHANRTQARRMLRAERRALRRLGVPDVPRPYDERGTNR